MTYLKNILAFWKHVPRSTSSPSRSTQAHQQIQNVSFLDFYETSKVVYTSINCFVLYEWKKADKLLDKVFNSIQNKKLLSSNVIAFIVAKAIVNEQYMLVIFRTLIEWNFFGVAYIHIVQASHLLNCFLMKTNAHEW